MFNRISSILHQAVEVIAPTVPQQSDFVAHWKAVTSFFTSTKDHKVSIDQTSLPQHLNSMFELLQEEEENGGPSRTGPCLEYVFQHKILETLSTLARTDTPPGMRQEVLLFFTKLLSRLDHPLLPHVHVHKPVQRLVRLCGDQRAGPTEEEEIHFLCTLCAKFTGNPYLVNFFIEAPAENNPANNNASPTQSGKIRQNLTVFPVVNSLLSLMDSPDARVAVKSCEGLMLLCSLSESSSAQVIVTQTGLCSYLAGQLCILCKRLPFALSPVDIEATQAKWGMDVHTVREDAMNFPGKHNLVAFLSWLDYCDQLISIATSTVAQAVATKIREQFLEGMLQSNLLQTSEAGSIAAIALLTRCLSCVHSSPLLTEFVRFILGEESAPEKPCKEHTSLRNKLILKCNHISDEVSLVTLKLFDTLLLKPDAFIYHSLVLRNLLSRQYLQEKNTNSINAQSLETLSLPNEQQNCDDLSVANTNQCNANITESMQSNPAVESTINGAIPDTEKGLTENEQSLDSESDQTKREGSPSQKLPNGERSDHRSEAESQNSETVEEASENGEDSLPNGSVSQKLSTGENENGNYNSDTFGETSQAGEEPMPNGTPIPEDKPAKPEPDASEETENCIVKEGEEVLQLLADLSLDQSDEKIDKSLSGDVKDEGNSSGLVSQMSNESDASLSASPEKVDNGNRSDIHSLVKNILELLPVEARSSADLGETGYDTYLRDAHAQYADTCRMCQKFEWPYEAIQDTEYSTQVFFEGEFMKVILYRLSKVMDQPYEMNLELTSVLSKLALLPHGNLHEYLLHATTRSCLVTVLSKVCAEISKRLRDNPALVTQLHNLRKRLSAFNLDIRSVENGNVLAGIIVVEEFCKELAAIAFVKHHHLE